VKRWLWLSFWGLASGCALVIGDLPEGVDPLAGGGGAAEAGGAAGSAGAGGEDAAAGVAGGAGAAGGSGASGNCVNPECDCDGDRHDRIGCAGGSQDDCDDEDPLVFVGQTRFFKTESKNHGFDYDCSGAPERDAPEVDCASALLPEACGKLLIGYHKPAPACGQVGTYGNCSWELAGLCKPAVLEPARTVACR
jgi:hypothetical protein